MVTISNLIKLTVNIGSSTITLANFREKYEGFMGRLSKVEDFEKVAKALRNSKSKSFQYQIKSFGYCHVCQKITEYDGNYSLEECYVSCHGCNNTFSDTTLNPRAKPAQLYSNDGEPMPEAAKKEIQKLHSRKKQKEFLKAELRGFMEHKMKIAEAALNDAESLRTIYESLLR